MTVTAVNDAPVLATSASTLNYAENGAPAVINSVITVADVDSANLIGATVAVTTGYVTGQDVLSYVTALGISRSFNSATGVLTLSGTTTVANYQTALRNVRYINLSNDPSNGTAAVTSRTVSFQVDDGGAVSNLSNVVTSNVDVTAVNNPPTAVALSGLYAQAGIPITYPASTLGGTDVEPGTTVSVVTTPDSLCAGCALTINANGSFVFTPPISAAGTTANFTYHVMDNGRPGTGVASTTVTVSFNVAGPAIYFVNSAAVGAGNCNLGSECTLTTALTNIGATTNARIFINDANTHTPAAVTLNSGGWLIGQGVAGTTFDALFGIAPSGAGTLATRPAINSTRPTISGAASTVTMNTNSAVRGLDINVSAGANRGLVASGLSSGTLTVSDINVTSAGGTAVDINTTTGVTLNVTGSPNVIISTTGKALSVVNTNLGATFRSISSNGAIVGISLTSTTGSLTVTGDGSGQANGSGGTIANVTTADTLNFPAAAMNALTASGTITLNSMNVTLNTSADHGMLFDNNAGGTLAANLTGMNFTGVTTSVSQNKALLQFETGGSANVTPNVQNAFFNGSRTYGMFTNAAGSSTMNVTLNQSGFGTNGNSGGAVNNPGSTLTSAPAIGLGITNSAGALVNYSVTNNTFWGANGLAGAIYAVTIGGAGSNTSGSQLNGSFTGNKIGQAGVAASGCSNSCAGLGLLPGLAGTFKATVTNNDIRQTNSHAISFADTIGPGASFVSSIKIKSNTLAEPDSSVAPVLQRAINVSGSQSGGSSNNNCLEIGDNTVSNAANRNIISGTWGTASTIIRTSNNANTLAMVLPGLTPLSAATTTQVNAYLTAANTLPGGATAGSVLGPGINGSATPCL